TYGYGHSDSGARYSRDRHPTPRKPAGKRGRVANRSFQEPVIQAEEHLDQDQNDDVPLEPMARAGGKQIGHGVRSLADHLELLADGPRPHCQIVVVRQLDPKTLELGMVPEHIWAIGSLDAASEPLLNVKRLSNLANQR